MPTVSEGPPRDEAADEPLMRELRTALRQDHPLPLLELVSGLMTSLDPRQRHPDDGAPREMTIATLADSFAHVDIGETTAALHALVALTPDELLATRLRKELAVRRQPMPEWLRDLAGVELTRVMRVSHVQGDGDDYMLGLRIPSGHELSLMVYVDHNMGQIVKDAVGAPRPFDDMLDTMAELIEDPDAELVDEDPARVRAVVTQAVDNAAATYPPYETDSWPHYRPIVEWVCRLLPEGGTVPSPREWAEEEREGLIAEFFASDHGKWIDGPEAHEWAHDFIEYGNGWGSGDPLVWSPVRVEMLLLDWIPRKIIASLDHLALAPHVLRPFVRFCHERVGLRRELTEETVHAVDRFEPGYQHMIRSVGSASWYLQDAKELVRREYPDIAPHFEGDDATFSREVCQHLEAYVGGADALARLDATSLPDEELSWSGIPEDIHDRVAEVLRLCDAFADERLDQEHRTAMRRFISRAASKDPQVFRRTRKPEPSAAAVAYVIADANDSLGPRLMVKDLMGWFGQKGGASQRAENLVRAIGAPSYHEYRGTALGTSDLLTSKRRAYLVRLRDRYRG